MTWILVINIQLSSWFGVETREIPFPDQESCIASVESLASAGFSDQGTILVYCRPVMK